MLKGTPILLEMVGVKKSSRRPNGDQLSIQKRVEAPFPTFILIHGYTISLRRSSLFAIQECRWFTLLVQKFPSDPFSTSSLYQATHKEPELQKRIQISLMMVALFQTAKSLQFRPPSAFESVIVSHETRAE